MVKIEFTKGVESIGELECRQNQKLRKLIEEKIKQIENNITGADKRIHPEIYNVAMNVCSNLKEILEESKNG